MAEPIEIPFRISTWIGPRKYVLGGLHTAPPGEYLVSDIAIFVLKRDVKLQLTNLANTVEPSMCSGYAACCQITLTACYIFATSKSR